MHDFHEPPSMWVKRFAPLIRPGGLVLDLACGRGRNARWLAEQGWRVLAVDHDADALATLADQSGIRTMQFDIEHEPWPFDGHRFDGIVICRYLHRPLLPVLPLALAEQGVLIYETFMTGQETFGKPSNPNFLLRQDELLETYADSLHDVVFEQGRFDQPKPAFLQRICAIR